MRIRRVVLITSFGLMSLLLSFLILTKRSAGEGAPVEVELKDGRRLSGLLVRVADGSYILQSPALAVLLQASEIRAVDGRAVAGPDDAAMTRIQVVQETFEDVRSDGSVLARSTLRRRNSGDQIIRQVNWGIAAHEVDELASYAVLDPFGNSVPYRVEDDPRIRGKRVFLDLPRPVLPGEELTLTTVVEERDRIIATGGARVYRIEGDYPEERLVTRSILLPAGARVIAVEPEPLQQLSAGGRTLVIWRRYFREAERFPWEIRYLP